LIYVDTSKEVGDKDHLKVFSNEDAAESWLQENDPEGVAFEYSGLTPPIWLLYVATDVAPISGSTQWLALQPLPCRRSGRRR
jgi:hypothetical protein